MTSSANKRKHSTNVHKSTQMSPLTIQRNRSTMASNYKAHSPNLTDDRADRCKGNQNQLDEKISRINETNCGDCDKCIRNRSEFRACHCSMKFVLNLPPWLPWLLTLLTLCLRVTYVTQPSNWWILHPDEIYQTIEVAHTEAYGYGFLPYEYLPPPGNDVTNMTLSAAHAQEIRLGMFSLRSYILPKLLSFVLALAETFGATWSPFLVIKTFHAILTSFLPLAVYRFTRSCYTSRDAGILAAMFISSSLCLNVFATHSLSNSFVSPFLFLALEPLVNLLKSVDTPTDFRIQSPNNHHATNGVAAHSVQNQTILDDLYDMNANFDLKCSKRQQNEKLKENCAVKPIHRNEAAALSYMEFSRHLKNILCGALLACCVYIRIDTVAIPAILTATYLDDAVHKVWRFINTMKFYVTGCVLGLFLSGYIDYRTYGMWFLSPMQWFRFNVLSQNSGAIFGVSPSLYYVKMLFNLEPLLSLVIILTIVGLLAEIIVENQLQHKVSHELRPTTRIAVLWVVLVTIYSSNKHKELRFVHNTIVFMYVLFSRAICSLFETVLRVAGNQKCKQHYTYTVYIFIALFMSSHLYDFYKISKSNSEKSKWSYGGSYDSDHVNICLDFIRQQSDVTGVFIDRPIHMTGGYSIIHKDIPLFALNKYEFMSFDESSKITIGRARDSNYQYTNDVNFKKVNVFGRVSEFISVYNTPYLFKQLLVKKQYNYLVLLKDRQFENIGYREVFESGNSRVLKRLNDPDAEELMANMTAKISLGSNATILEYEGDWLAHFGLYGKAEQRLLFANRLDPHRIGPFQVLLEMYRKLGVGNSYENVLKACMQLHSIENCLKPYTPIKLHSDYYRREELRQRGTDNVGPTT